MEVQSVVRVLVHELDLSRDCKVGHEGEFDVALVVVGHHVVSRRRPRRPVMHEENLMVITENL